MKLTTKQRSARMKQVWAEKKARQAEAQKVLIQEMADEASGVSELMRGAKFNTATEKWGSVNLSTSNEGTKKALDLVNHPPHYTNHPSGIECITVTEHMSFNLGNAVKYVWRAGEKDCAIMDLEKAIWYIEREIGRLAK